MERGDPVTFPVTMSGSPLEFDTLPALKTRRFFGSGSAEARTAARIYTMARLYLLDGALRLSLVAFEREPAPQSRVLFALAGEDTAADGKLALVCLSPGEARLMLADAATPPPLWEPFGKAVSQPLPAEFFAGVDEQGWYWGAQTALPADALQQAGCRPAQGAAFRAALYKFCEGAPAFGTSAMAAKAEHPLDALGFDNFTFVSY